MLRAGLLPWLVLGAWACTGAQEGSPADAGADAWADSGHGDGGAAEPCSPYASREPAPEVFVGPEGLSNRLVEAVDAARTSLHVAIYEIDAPPIVDALARAAGRGVDVRVLYDPDREANHEALEQLEASGVRLHPASAMYEHYHAKLVLVDGDRAIVTSANLNQYSMQTERNHGVVLRDAHDLTDLAALYELDWSDGTAAADLRCTRLVISPSNSRDRIEGLVRRATDELRLQQLSLTDDGVRAALAEQADAGVQVRVILADPAWIESNADSAQWLRDAGIEVRFLRRPENHAKLIIADRQAALVGSHNLSWTSLERNREVGAILTGDRPLERLVAAFESDWDIAGP